MNNVNPADINKTIAELHILKNNNIVVELDDSLDIETVKDIFIRIISKGIVLFRADLVMFKISSNEKNMVGILLKDS